MEMAVRRVTRLDRQNDKHLKRHKRRAELAFTSVPIFLFYLKEAHSGALVLPASNVWAFLVFSENCCYFLAFCLQRKNQGSTVTGTTGATVGSCIVKKPAPSHSSVFFSFTLSGSFISSHFETKSMLKMTVGFQKEQNTATPHWTH